jgi:signal peptidase I
MGLLFIAFVGQRSVVHGMSMSPTLENGDQLFIEKLTPKIGIINRGDIVTIYANGMLESGKDYLVKRVIALEGDSVRIDDGVVYLNGKPIEEDYIQGDYTYEERLESEITIKKDQVFVMGDNRLKGGSKDSRTLGVFDVKAIRGKVLFRWFPFSRFGTV